MLQKLSDAGAKSAFLPLLFLGIPFAAHTQPLRIQSVEIVRQNIFDEDSQDATLITDIVNKVHVITREDVIRRELLFAEGEVYDREKVEESVRNLRNMRLFSDVTVQMDTLDGENAAVRVLTRERWTLQGAAMIKQEAGIRTGTLGISEDNLLGGGQRVSLYTNYSSSRNNPYGFQTSVEENRLFGSRWRAAIQYRNAEEFRHSSLNVERPFYAEDAEWAGGATVARARERIWYDFANPDNEQSFRYGTTLRLWYARSSGEDAKIRWGAAYHHARARALPRFLTPSGTLDMVNMSIGFMRRTYFQTSYVDQIGDPEYVATGFAFSAVGGMNLTYSDDLNNRYFVRLNSRLGGRPAEELALYSDLSASTYTDLTDVRDAMLSWETSFSHRVGERNTSAGRFFVVRGRALSPSRQVILGGLNGLRGFGPYDFSGTNAALVNVEHRFFPGLEVWYFRPGLTVFLDSGVTWGEGERFAQKQWRTSAGVGLRIANRRFLGSTIIRVDFAFNFMTRQWGQITVSTDQAFRAIRGVDTDLPTIVE